MLPPSTNAPIDVDWPDDAVHDRLAGGWHLWQRKGGHRTSTDDLLTAWLATVSWRALADHPPARYLDIGCGIGSVLLMTARALRPTVCIGVEAQAQSAAMARATVAALPDPPTIGIVNGDLRDAEPGALGGAFPLITGSPPYLPEGTGVVSPDPQRAACRFELRGGVEAYCEAAARLLTPDGMFCLVFQTEWDERVLAAGDAAGLHLRGRADIRTRTDRPAPFLSVYRFTRAAGTVEETAFATRNADGSLTDAYVEVRRALALD